MSESIEIGYQARLWQVQFHIMPHRFRVVVVPRGCGKTYGIQYDLLDRALRKPNGIFSIISPFLKQGKRNIWRSLSAAVRKIPGAKINQAELFIELPNGTVIYLFGADNAEALRGMHQDGLVIDEAADILDDDWRSVIAPTLSSKNGWAIISGTPKGVNFLYDCYIKAKNGEEDWGLLFHDVYSVGVYDEKQIQTFKNLAGMKFNQEYLCAFDASSDKTLLQMADAIAASSRVPDEEDTVSGVVFGVDVARGKGDNSCVYIRQGVHTREVWKQKTPNMKSFAMEIRRLVEKWKPESIHVDTTNGDGGAIVDELRSLGIKCIPVAFSNRANDKVRFYNIRSEMWYKMADWVRDGGCIPEDPELMREICMPQTEWRGDQMLLEPKEAIKKRLGGASPDMGDALALTFAFPVLKRRVVNLFDRVIARVSEYNPWGEYS